MLLHDHPVNLERERQGKLVVNSLWLWGGGVLPQVVGSPFGDVWADDVLVRGLTHASAQILPFSAWEWLEGSPVEGAHLIVLDDLRKADFRTDIANWREALGHLERHWFAPMHEMLKGGQVASLHLHLVQTHSIKSFAVSRHDFWKFWRRAQPLWSTMEENA
jgi:hypothetical protein